MYPNINHCITPDGFVWIRDKDENGYRRTTLWDTDRTYRFGWYIWDGQFHRVYIPGSEGTCGISIFADTSQNKILAILGFNRDNNWGRSKP